MSTEYMAASGRPSTGRKRENITKIKFAIDDVRRKTIDKISEITVQQKKKKKRGVGATAVLVKSPHAPLLSMWPVSIPPAWSTASLSLSEDVQLHSAGKVLNQRQVS
ncbi:hypothetical protein TNCV_659251 [Trichonephila clavipes]|nr:hypothetical protein TNCV_659251 [Trichonephila clavipes]